MIRTAASALAIVALFALAPGAHAKGCIKGALVGGAAGHMVGHGKIGAAAGCVVGHHNPQKQEKQQQQTEQTSRGSYGVSVTAVIERLQKPRHCSPAPFGYGDHL